ncbi:MAG: pyridoxamine 5'-phosphate oxidase family protein [Gemmatimonadetes bacterium]|nr:pyridoxamine 5'-phosphate oxidase family protein [Gemmatimonadota bacterium]
MTSFYSPAQRALQDRFGATKLADLMTQAIVHAEVQEDERAFIESRDMFFLSTVDAAGQPTCSYKGGDPGFVRVVDLRTLAFPVYDGNGMYLSAGNIAATGKVGLLFIAFDTPHRLRVQGTATVQAEDPLLAAYPGADLIVRVAIDAMFVNCSRYVHRHSRVAASPYVPRTGCETPYATWKRIDLVQEALPPRDAGKTVRAGGTITMEEYSAKLMAGEA